VDALPVTLQRIGFAPPTQITVGPGETDGVISGAAALSARLPSGWKRLSFSLPSGIVAELSRAGVTQASIMGTARPRTLPKVKRTAWFSSPGPENAAFSLSCSRSASRNLFCSRWAAHPLQPHRRHAAYALGAALPHRCGWPRRDGNYRHRCRRRGDHRRQRAGGAGGTALVSVPRTRGVSMDGPGVAAGQLQTVTAPGSLTLSGSHMSIVVSPGKRGSSISKPTHLWCCATRSPASRRSTPMVPLPTCSSPRPARLRLICRQPAASTGWQCPVDAVAAIPISDVSGRIFSSPRQSRLFMFSLDAPRTIGVGVRGSVDDAEVRLLGSNGGRAGSGRGADA